MTLNPLVSPNCSRITPFAMKVQGEVDNLASANNSWHSHGGGTYNRAVSSLLLPLIVRTGQSHTKLRAERPAVQATFRDDRG